MTAPLRITGVATIFLTILMLGGAAANPAALPANEVTRSSGGSIRTVLVADSPTPIVLDDGSTLNREWIAIKQASMPAKLKGTPGVKTVYKAGSGGSYEYTSDFEVDVTVPIVAIEVRFITFNIWGERVNSLVSTDIKDFTVGTQKLHGIWRLYSENEASEYYASIGYVSRIRTKDGRVLSADVRPVLAEAQKFNAKFVESDLNPEKPTK